MADELDTTLLIAEVHKRPMLYSKADQDYLNKAKKDQTWERIATKFGTSGLCFVVFVDLLRHPRF